MGLEKDELDELIELESIKTDDPLASDPPSGDPPADPDKPASDPPKNDIDKDKRESAAAPDTSKINPRDLGFEHENWDGIKAEIGEVKNLRQKLELAENQPKTVFANEKMAGLNALLAARPSLSESKNAFSIYEDITSLTNEDPLKVLVTKFILDKPEYVGKEDFVAKKISQKYNIEPAEGKSEEEIQFNKIELERDATLAFTEIKGLRESLKTAGSSSAPAPTAEEVATRETASKTMLQQELSGFTKLPIPMLNPDTKKYETFIEYDIPKEMIDAFADKRAKAYARIANADSPEVKSQIRKDFVSTVLYESFGHITQAIRTKQASDTRLEVESEYDGAGKLKDKEAPPAKPGVDPYDEVFGKL